jgi:hypothetical protein
VFIDVDTIPRRLLLINNCICGGLFVKILNLKEPSPGMAGVVLTAVIAKMLLFILVNLIAIAG